MLKLTLGPGREPLDETEIRKYRAGGTVLFDEQRRRPRYFDGRFLAARDLTREQSYFLGRQASLGQILGSGVVTGLLVGHAGTASSLQITPGYGLTLGGELVSLQKTLTLELEDVVEAERLNAAFGLRRIPRPPSRGRTGVFVVGLRPVEFTANPIASYPTSLDGPRTLEDGDIVEASAVSLIPYPEDGSREEPGIRRARIARTLFVEGSTRGIPTDVLPLALVALDRGTVQWVDSFLVRREVGAGHVGHPALGLAPQALREAHLLQYELHLQEVLAERQSGNRSPRFAASEHFLALPPAGRLPAATIDGQTFTQLYFPPEVDVDIALVPEDEVPALLRDSLLLPPIDLSAGRDMLEATSVLALVPVGRSDLRDLSGILVSLTRKLRPVLPGGIASLRPIDMINALTLPRVILEDQGGSGTAEDQAWSDAIKGAGDLWYVRRRHLSRRLEKLGANVLLPAAEESQGQLASDEAEISLQVLNIFKPYSLEQSLTEVREQADTDAWENLAGLFLQLTGSRVLLEGALREAEAKNPLDKEAAEEVVKRFMRPQVRKGLGMLAKAHPHIVELNSKAQQGGIVSPTGGNLLAPIGIVAVKAHTVPELGELAYDLDDASALAALATELITVTGGHAGKTAQESLRQLVLEKLEGLQS
jgi:hypothetical protein